MLRKVVIGVLVAAVSVIVCARQPGFVATRLPGAVIADANEALRVQLSQAMEQMARSLGLTLDARDLVFICRDDLIMANSGVAGFEDAESSTGVLRVDVGLIYLSREATVRFGDGKLGSRLPAGFHVVRASVDRSRTVHDPGTTILEIAESSGRSVLAFTVTALPPPDERRLTASLAVGPSLDDSGVGGRIEDVACLGWYGPRFGCEMCIVLEQEEQDRTGLGRSS